MSLWEKLSGKSGKKRAGSGKDSGGGKNSGRSRIALRAQASGAVLPGLSAPASAFASASAFTSGPVAPRGKVAYSAFLGTNYGSTLQAFALYHTILSLGYDCEVVCCACFTDAPKPGKKLKQENPRRYEYRRMRYLFAQFINANFRLSTELGHISPPCSADQVRELESFDAFVCGSDQIWNPQSFWFSPASYLDFAPEGKRIAYAPSIGLRTIPEKLSGNMRRWYERLRGMDFLSVRERSSAPMIERITCREPRVVLDPTFLLSPDEWLATLPDPVYSPEITGILKSGRKYLLAYLLDHAPLFQEMIEKFAAEEDLAVVWLTGRDNDGRPLQNCSETDPAGFVHLMANAEYVCADGFHGTCFALNFRKPFVFLSPAFSAGQKLEIRIGDLFKELSVPLKHIASSLEVLFKERFYTDYKTCDLFLTELKKNSLEYLSASLKQALLHCSHQVPPEYQTDFLPLSTIKQLSDEEIIVQDAGILENEPKEQGAEQETKCCVHRDHHVTEMGYREFPKISFCGSPLQETGNEVISHSKPSELVSNISPEFSPVNNCNGSDGDSSSNRIQEEYETYDFKLDRSHWKISCENGSTVLRTLSEKPGKGHYAWINFPNTLQDGKPCSVRIIFKCKTASNVISFHTYNPESQRMKVVHTYRFTGENKDRWTELTFSFLPNAANARSLMIGAYHLSGKDARLCIKNMYFSQ